MPQLDARLSPTSEIEEVLFLLYRNEIPVTIADTAIIRDGVLKGLFYCPNQHADCPIQFDPDWPMVDYDSHQTRMYSTKRASEAAAKVEVAGNFFSKECTTFDAPIVIHMTTASSSRHLLSEGASESRSSVDVSCQFLTKSRLLELLRANQLADGLVCRYVVPNNRHHHLVRALFTPFSMQLEQHESCPTVDDAALSMAERVATSPGNGGAYRSVQPTSEMKDYASAFCSRLFDFFRLQGATLDRGIFFFIQNIPGRMTFLWSSELLLKPWFLEDGFVVTDASRGTDVQDAQLAISGQLSSAAISQSFGGLAKSGATTLLASPSSSKRVQSTPSFAMALSTMNSEKQQLPHVDASGQRLLCPSPVPPALQADCTAQVFADAKDFGFYSGEPERIRDSMKRQIRSIVNVQLPSSMDVDDTPPYDDDFIAALLDPEKAEAYFFPTSFGTFGKNRKNTGLLRSKSKVFRFVDTDEAQLAERSAKLEKTLGSFRRIRTGSLSTWSAVGERDASCSTFNTPTNSAAPSAEVRRNSSIAFTDPEVSAILVKNSDSEAAHVSVLQAGLTDDHRDAVDEIDKSKPDWKHSGHMAQLRRKYGKFKFHKEEEEAELRRLTSISLAIKTAEHCVSRRLSSAGSASSGTQLSNQTRSSRSNKTKQELSREKGWVGASHADYNASKPFRRLAKPPPSTTEILVSRAIPKYEAKLSQGSLMGYLVGTEHFEKKSVEHLLDVPIEDCRSGGKDRSASEEPPVVPDPPVVDLTNLHMSISEELIAQRKCDGDMWCEQRSMLEMLFGPYNVSIKSLQAMVGIGVPRESRVLSPPRSSRRDRSKHGRQSSDCFGEASLSFSASAQHLATHAFADHLARSQQMDDKKKRQMNFHRHGITDSKEKVQLIVGTFEDLVYQWASDPAHDLKHIAAINKLNRVSASPSMVLFVPPAYFELRRELRSLFLNLGFKEESVEATSIAAYQQAITDDFLEEVPQFVTLFSTDVTAVTVSRVISGAKLFAADVAQLYADEKWDIIEKIREMTETQGFTFVDAVLMVASGNLMERSSVSAPSFSFSHLKM